jgi:hydroxyethylthiazole kinase-like uncharacterized protein yjeF
MNIEINDIKDLFKERKDNANKGNFGTCGILGGSINYTGSVKLATLACSAMRSGAGICRIIIDEYLTNAITPYILEETLWPLDNDLDKAIRNLDSLAIGMGWGISDKNTKMLKYILKNYKGILIIDADGLNILAKNLDLLSVTKAQVILTPHPKEFSRIINKDIKEILDDPIKYTMDFAKKYHVIVLLKGARTIVADGDDYYEVNIAVPGLATAGAGDVLSGILAGFMAYNKYNIKSVAAAALLNALAGKIAEDKYTDIAMIAHDTIECIPDAIKKLRGDE